MAEYKLKHPIKNVNGEEITAVKIKEGFSGADLEIMGNASEKGEGTMLVTIASQVVEDFSPTYIRAMDARDVKALAEIGRSFLDDGEG